MLLSSHILSEAEALSDRVSIIRHGRVVETGTLDRAAPPHPHRRDRGRRRAPDRLDAVSGVHDVRVVPHGDGSRVTCEVDAQALDALLAALSGAGVRGLTSAPPTLEELFLRHYSDDLAGSGTGGVAA